MAATRKSKKATAPPPNDDLFPIVGIGASAGGIEAITALLKDLPDAPGMALVFVLHQDPKHESQLGEILTRSAKMRVHIIRQDMPIEKDRLYVAPHDAEVRIEDGLFRLQKRGTETTLIDSFFRSLAADQGSRAIAVVLSGSASDGALGTKAIKAEGGITFAQDGSARMESMPHATIAASHVDFVLAPHEIAKELLRIARHDYVTRNGAGLPESEIAKLFSLIRARHDTDFTHYKPATIERRIRRRMAVRKVDTLQEYLSIVRADPSEIEQLYGDILIHLTGFFRDRPVFDILQQKIFPELIHGRSKDRPLRIWVPGCSTGEEAYSLAIALLETSNQLNSSVPIQIFGTDVSNSAIERARAGLYPERIDADITPERLRRFFTKAGGGYRVNRAVRDLCIFARQNVTKDPPFSKLDLISCRNVMIYFGAVLQRRVISVFHYALRPDGFLLLGSAETVGNFGELFGMIDRKHKIYRKKTVIARPAVDFTMAPTPPRAPSEPDVTQREQVAPPNAIFREADRVLLNRYSPAGVVINDSFEVLQFRGRTGNYLEPPTGTASFNLFKMAREGLLADLRSAIHEARKHNAAQHREGLRVDVDDHAITVNIEVIPLLGASKERFLLVLFEEARVAEKKTKKKASKKEAEEAESRKVARMKRELDATREYLQSIIEQQEAMNEELRSANEEIESSNEEILSTNEELETAKEEMQSTNEELITLNEELESRNQELIETNNDLMNVLASVDVPVLIVDRRLRIRRFNPGAQRALNLAPSDAGRSIADVKSTLRVENLETIIVDVNDKLETRELEVSGPDGHKRFLRIRPYKTADNKIDGAVLVLVDLD